MKYSTHLISLFKEIFPAVLLSSLFGDVGDVPNDVSQITSLVPDEIHHFELCLAK